MLRACRQDNGERRPLAEPTLGAEATVMGFDNVATDAIYRQHATPAIYGFQSYISVPIILADGTFFGTLCAIDPRPARLFLQRAPLDPGTHDGS